VAAWNHPRNARDQAVLRRDGQRAAYIDVAELTGGSTHPVVTHACQFVATGGQTAVIVSGTWKNGTVPRWSMKVFPPQLPLPAGKILNVRVLRDGKLRLR
jgi:hypothetical protein